MRRVQILGNYASGKTHLAGRLSERLAVPLISLDDAHWCEGWARRPADEFRSLLLGQLDEHDGWVLDGDDPVVRAHVWQRADTLIWLDYPLSTVLRRLLIRTARRVVTREPIHGGNVETVGRHIASRDSLFIWAVRENANLRRAYGKAFGEVGRWGQLRLRLRTPRDTDRLLAHLVVD